MKPGSIGAAVLTFLLAGCSSGGNDDYAQYFAMMRQGFGGFFSKSSITLKQAADIPYASMGWRLNNGSQNIIVLATDNSGEQLWTSADHIVFRTRDGRIQRTVGLPHDLGGLTAKSGSSLPAPMSALKAPYSDQRVADFPDLGIYAATITCRGRVAGRQVIQILGKPIKTTRVDESCTSFAMGWSFTNRFWVDVDSGFVWKADQMIHPGDASVQTEVFRPPG